ncbi:MAG TPA: RNB domain-containing ribonuclease [Myxococcaceae bacterium]|nr:RNB domain-containing ribonuclease [Myxococcaceae bacterium]
MSFDLADRARRALLELGFLPDFPPDAEAQLAAIQRSGVPSVGGVEDLRGLLWSSIDNPESMDLDQLEWAEALPDGSTRLLVAIADVDALVPEGTPLDRRAGANTASLYTGAAVFPMLPRPLSEDLTSLLDAVDRLSVVIGYRVRPDGSVDEGGVRRAWVRNKAKLSYPEVGPWLQGDAPVPPRVAAVGGLEPQLRLQDRATRALRSARERAGALALRTLEPRPVMSDGKVLDLEDIPESRSRELIEDLMVAANGVMARFLDGAHRSSLARVVRKPKRWERIVALAQGLGTALPSEPDGVALSRFLQAQKTRDPLHFPDLSLSVVKLLGPGEYVLRPAGEDAPGHFGLAANDYSHSTAPNRRYPDLVTQRLVKTLLAGTPPPYSDGELDGIAQHCTLMEAATRKLERLMRKVIAALLLHDRVGQVFDGLVTGVTEHGTFVRLLKPPAEGRVVRGESGMDVGERVRVRLLATDPERGFIDFGRA